MLTPSSFFTASSSTLLNNFTDEEKLDLTPEDHDVLDHLFDDRMDAEEYSYFFSSQANQQELRF